MKYIGITIGPIYKTMKQAKKTRELWAASYMFSYILRQIANKFDREFILPKKDDSIKDIGVFNDRCIFAAQEGDLERLPKAIDEVLHEFAKENGVSFEFLKEYLQIHFVEVDVENLEKENIVNKVFKYLDSQELFFTTTQKDELQHFFANIHKSQMMEFAFGKDKKFPTLLEIAMHDPIKEEKFTKEELRIIRGFEDMDEAELFLESKYIPNYYKYVAIVKADGDNMGAVNKLLKQKREYVKLSEDLFNFIQTANEKIKAFGGRVILGSGDDLLFIAPIVSHKQNIFDLIYAIKELYKKQMQDWNEKLSTPTTLSFGVSISYFKYPLFEAFELANTMLYDVAKEIKDTVAFSALKHSGQNFMGIIPNTLEKDTKDLLHKDFKFDSSVIYKLHSNQFLLDYIGKNKRDFLPFFKNNFNENFEEEILAKLASFLTKLYEDDIINSDKFIKLLEKLHIDNNIFLLYSILRFNHFTRDTNENVSETQTY